MKTLIFVIAFLVLVGCKTTDQESEIDKLIIREMTNFCVPGLAYALIKDGEVISKGYYGTTVRNGDVSINKNSRFHIGSNTKSMTALLAAIAVEKGEIEWDTSIKDVLGSEVVPESYRDLTLELLLSHRAGVPSIPAGSDWVTYFGSEDKPWVQRKKMVMDTFKLPLRYEPGYKTEYSNMGFVIAGHMLEEVTDLTWEGLIINRIFNPLDMKGIGFGPPGVIGKNQPWGHKPELVDPFLINADNPPGMGPAGTVHSTLDDMIKYVKVWLNEGEPLIERDSFDYMVENKGFGFGLGWLIIRNNLGLGLAHDGSNRTFYSSIYLATEADIGVVVLTNSGQAAPAIERIVEALFLELIL